MIFWVGSKCIIFFSANFLRIANTPYLPYGQYLVKETVTPKDYITAPDFLISVSDDYTEYDNHID